MVIAGSTYSLKGWEGFSMIEIRLRKHPSVAWAITMQDQRQKE